MTDITKGTVTKKAGTGNDALSVTCGGSDRYLLFFLNIVDLSNPADRVATVDFNGTGMTRLGGAIYAVNTAEVELWGLANPDNGTAHNVNFSFAGGIHEYQAVAVPLANVDQSTSYDDVQTAAGAGGTSQSVSLTSSKDRNQNYSMIGTASGASAWTPQSGETEIAEQLDSATDTHVSEEDNVVTPAGAETIGWTWTTSKAHAMIGITMRPVTSATNGKLLRLFSRMWDLKNGIIQPRKGLYLPDGKFLPI